MEVLEQFKTLFEPELVEAIEQKATLVNVREGETILEVGQIIRTVPIILSGLVKVSRIEDDGKELLLYYVNPNESCAMTFTCCMQQHVSEIQAVAEEDVTMLAINLAVLIEARLATGQPENACQNPVTLRKLRMQLGRPDFAGPPARPEYRSQWQTIANFFGHPMQAAGRAVRAFALAGTVECCRHGQAQAQLSVSKRIQTLIGNRDEEKVEVRHGQQLN